MTDTSDLMPVSDGASGNGDETPPSAPASPHLPADNGKPDHQAPRKRPFRAFRRRTRWLLTGSVTGWLIVFTLGMSVPTKPFRDMIVTSCFSYVEPTKRLPPPSTAGLGGQFTDDAQEAEEDKVDRKLAGDEARQKSESNEVASDDNTGSTGPQTEMDKIRAELPKVRTLQPSELLLWSPLLFLLILLCFTPTNLVLLCCFGSLMGAFAMRLTPGIDRGRQAGAADTERHSARPRRTTPVVTALLNGLCVYLGIFAGLIVINGEVIFDTSKPEFYQRIAAVATLFSVAAGTTPTFIHNVRHLFTPWGNGSGGK